MKYIFLTFYFVFSSIVYSQEVSIPKFSFNIYGFLKADYMYASKAVLTFGRETLLSPNEVKRVTQRDDEQARSNIQVSETRIGFKVAHGENLNGIVELDFINFDQSSPNVNSRPRLRQAVFHYKLLNNLKIFAGQAWDIYSPVRDASYNIIGNFFYTGNHGWMREQMGIIYTISQTNYLSFALGNSGVNVNPYPSVRLEQSRVPTFAFQWKSILNSENTFYLSGIFTNKLYQDPELVALKGRSLYYDGYVGKDYAYPPPSPFSELQTESSSPVASQVGKSTKVRRNVMGISLGYEYRSERKYHLKIELNYGQNIGDIFSLSVSEVQATTRLQSFENSKLGYLTNSQLQSKNIGTWGYYLRNQTQFHSIREMGGWFSFYFPVSEKWEVGIFAGLVKVLNPSKLNPSTVANTRTLEVLDATNWGTPGNSPAQGSMRENRGLGLNLAFIPEQQLKLYIQADHMKSYFKDAERNSGFANHISSYDLDTQTLKLREVGFSHERASASPSAYIFRFGTIYQF